MNIEVKNEGREVITINEKMTKAKKNNEREWEARYNGSKYL